jgi:hypothetical protein
MQFETGRGVPVGGEPGEWIADHKSAASHMHISGDPAKEVYGDEQL